MYIPEELKQYLTPDGAVDLENTEISAGGFVEIPDGQYVAKLTAVDLQEPKPEWERKFYSLQVAFTIQDGKFKDQDARDWWSLEVQPPKEGKTGLWAPDVARIKQAAANIGEKMGPVYVFEPEKARKQVAKTFGRKMLDVSIKTETYAAKVNGKPTGEMKKKTRVTILGLHKAQQHSAPVPAAAQAEPDDDDLV